MMLSLYELVICSSSLKWDYWSFVSRIFVSMVIYSALKFWAQNSGLRVEWVLGISYPFHGYLNPLLVLGKNWRVIVCFLFCASSFESYLVVLMDSPGSVLRMDSKLVLGIKSRSSACKVNALLDRAWSL